MPGKLCHNLKHRVWFSPVSALGIWPSFGSSLRVPFDAKVIVAFLVASELSNVPQSTTKWLPGSDLEATSLPETFLKGGWIILARQDPQDQVVFLSALTILLLTRNLNRLWQWTFRMKFILCFTMRRCITRTVPRVWSSLNFLKNSSQ